MNRTLRWLIRIAGFTLILGALYPFWLALKSLDHREYVSALLAIFVGWLVLSGGVELLRPESAE